jgi:hypothetical protein
MVRRLLALALLLAAASCSSRVDVDDTYCPLASVPYKGSSQLHDFRAKIDKVFAEEETYDSTDRNRRIVTAARSLQQASRAYELKQKNPALFTKGDDQGMAGAAAELKAACKVPKKK